MRAPLPCLCLILISGLGLSVLMRPAVGGTPAQPPAPNAFTGAWSKAVDGLEGRLVVHAEDLKPGRRHGVTLELRNVGTQPLSVTNQPEITATLRHADGREVATAGYSMSGPIPYPQTAVLPRDAYLGFRVDMQTVGVPTYGPRLLAVGGQVWVLTSGAYRLRAAVKMPQHGSPGKGAWSGRLELPPVTLRVSRP